MIDAPALMTADELFTYDARGKRTELLRGRLVVREPASYGHGAVAARVLVCISTWLETDRRERHADAPRGDVLAAETGFTLARNPDTVRAPDVAYVRAERRPTSSRGFPELAPDLAVEVLSPDDRPGEVLAKVGDWLNAGTVVVWVIDPQRRVAQHFVNDGTITLLGEHDTLNAAPVLEGLHIPLSSLWSPS